MDFRKQGTICMDNLSEKDFLNCYWKQYIMLEKEFRTSNKYVSLTERNSNTFSDFFVKIILQIGSEIDVISRTLCRNINSSSSANDINGYRNEILLEYKQLKDVEVKCNDFIMKPWKDWDHNTPFWWKIYNGVKHDRYKEEYYGDNKNEKKENYKFATLGIVLNALSGLFLLELYLYLRTSDRKCELDAPLPGSKLFIPTNCGWEDKDICRDTYCFINNETGHLMIYEGEFLYYEV